MEVRSRSFLIRCRYRSGRTNGPVCSPARKARRTGLVCPGFALLPNRSNVSFGGGSDGPRGVSGSEWTAKSKLLRKARLHLWNAPYVGPPLAWWIHKSQESVEDAVIGGRANIPAVTDAGRGSVEGGGESRCGQRIPPVKYQFRIHPWTNLNIAQIPPAGHGIAYPPHGPAATLVPVLAC